MFHVNPRRFTRKFTAIGIPLQQRLRRIHRLACEDRTDLQSVDNGLPAIVVVRHGVRIVRLGGRRLDPLNPGLQLFHDVRVIVPSPQIRGRGEPLLAVAAV